MQLSQIGLARGFRPQVLLSLVSGNLSIDDIADSDQQDQQQQFFHAGHGGVEPPASSGLIRVTPLPGGSNRDKDTC